MRYLGTFATASLAVAALAAGPITPARALVLNTFVTGADISAALGSNATIGFAYVDWR